jgi:hypothetical protein
MFLLLGKKLSIIDRKLLQLNEEITKIKPETVVIAVVSEQTFDKGSDLGARAVSIVTSVKARPTYSWRLGKALCSKFATNSDKKSLLLGPVGA